MTPAEIRAKYREYLTDVGETVTLRRYTSSTEPRTYDESTCLARVTGYEPHEIVGLIQQGDRKAILLAEDLEAGNIDLPLGRGDKIVVRGAELNIEAADDSTRRVAGTLVAVECQVRG